MKKSIMISMMSLTFATTSMASISFPCFEYMANAYGKSKVETKELSAEEKRVVEAAVADAMVRASEKAATVSQKAEVRIHRAYGNKITSLNIITSDDPEYGSYFLYSYDDYDKKLYIMSEHLGDDQGPELNVICSGWGPGSVVKKF